MRRTLETVMRCGWMRGGACMVSLAFAAAGCSSATPTEMTNVWKDPGYTAGPMKNFFIFGGRLNATNRRTLEDGFVAALTARGVRATPSYTLFPGDYPSKEEARSAVQGGGYDGLLVASMRGANEQEYVPGVYTGGFWDGYYGPGWGGAWDPGYVVTEEVVKFQTSLWDARGQGKLVWSAITETENPTSGKDFVSSLTGSVVPALAKAGFLPPQGGKNVSYSPSWSVH